MKNTKKISLSVLSNQKMKVLKGGNDNHVADMDSTCSSCSCGSCDSINTSGYASGLTLKAIVLK